MRSTRQIHCLLDCLSYGLQTNRLLDDRPLYFGIWNAPFAVTDRGISYYSKDIDTECFIGHFEQLYGQAISPLLDHRKNKLGNYALLKERLMNKDEGVFFLIIVDLYYLNYPNQCYRVKHRPHILIADHLRGEECFLVDPFFDWEGCIPLGTLKESYYCGDLCMTLAFDNNALHEPSLPAISRLFALDYTLIPSKLILQVEAIVRKVIAEEEGYSLRSLYEFVEQTGVIAKRWKGYEKAYSYFSEALRLNPDEFYGKVGEIMKRWESILLSIVRIGILGKREELVPLIGKVNQIGQLETSVKQELWGMYNQWAGLHDAVSI